MSGTKFHSSLFEAFSSFESFVACSESEPFVHELQPPELALDDVAVRALLRTNLSEQYAEESDTVIVDELGLCRGQNRVDVVVVNGLLHGYEIKSDRDTLRRLPTQVAMYNQVLDRMTLVAGEKHLAAATQMVPAWWGVTAVKIRQARPVLKVLRKGRKNPARDPRALVELLWHSEALELLENRGLAKGVRGKPRAAVWDRVCEHFTLDEIARAVRCALKVRKAR